MAGGIEGMGREVEDDRDLEELGDRERIDEDAEEDA